MKTRDGRSVRIFCADGGGTFPVVGAISGGKDIAGNLYWVSARWSLFGEPHVACIGYDIHPGSLPEFKAAIAGGDGWRPIDDTAKDGRDFLVSGIFQGKSVAAVAAWIEGVWLPHNSMEGIAFEPTHYRFLPAPPEVA